jgi:hypothetical protein
MLRRRQSPLLLIAVLLLVPFLVLRSCSRRRVDRVRAADSIHYELSGGLAMSFALSSTAFSNGGEIARRYTCDGEDLSPALAWQDAPAGTQSLALIADDPDAPMGTWTHWLLWNIPPKATLLPEDVAKIEVLDNAARQGINDFKRIGYGGPCPPPGKAHRYFFKLYALNARLDLKPGATKAELELAIKPHVLAEAQWMGTYQR